MRSVLRPLRRTARASSVIVFINTADLWTNIVALSCFSTSGGNFDQLRLTAHSARVSLDNVHILQDASRFCKTLRQMQRAARGLETSLFCLIQTAASHPNERTGNKVDSHRHAVASQSPCSRFAVVSHRHAETCAPYISQATRSRYEVATQRNAPLQTAVETKSKRSRNAQTHRRHPDDTQTRSRHAADTQPCANAIVSRRPAFAHKRAQTPRCLQEVSCGTVALPRRRLIMISVCHILCISRQISQYHCLDQ